MTLPLSGPLSMGDINVELGRSRTTANTSLAGGSTPTSNSLFGLANSTVNKTAPHRISEFYGYDNNPAGRIEGFITKFPSTRSGTLRLIVNGTIQVSLTTSGTTGQFTLNAGDTYSAALVTTTSLDERTLTMTSTAGTNETITRLCFEAGQLTTGTYTAVAGEVVTVNADIFQC